MIQLKPHRILSILTSLLLSLGVATTLLAQTPIASPDVAENEAPQPTISGNAIPLLAPGTTQEVEVVSYGEYDGSIIPVLVRNNSGSTAYNIEVKVEARDGNGSLVGVGESSISHSIKPRTLNSGEYAIGWVFLDIELPADGKFEFKPLFDVEPDYMTESSIQLHFGEVNWLQDRIVGEIVNPTEEPIRNIWLNAMCFDVDGKPLSVEIHSMSETVPANGMSSFQIQSPVFGDVNLCERFVVSGTASKSD